jgi:hypothetical protein
MEINITEKQLVNELEKFFKENSSNRNIWCQTELGKYLKNKINSLGYWKNAARGNPRKGFDKMRETIARQNGWE